MTIDERLDKLTERHEALTQTVELIAHMQQENEKAQQKNQVLLAEIGEDLNPKNSSCPEGKMSEVSGTKGHVIGQAGGSDSPKG